MLTPDDFSNITGLRLCGERIHVNDSFTSTKLKKLLGVVPSRLKSNNIPLSWLCENIPQCETMAKGARMFMLLLGSLRKIEQIRNYDWGGMAYATLMHFMTQLSRWSLSSLGWIPFVWHVRFEIFWLCVGFGIFVSRRECWSMALSTSNGASRN